MISINSYNKLLKCVRRIIYEDEYLIKKNIYICKMTILYYKHRQNKKAVKAINKFKNYVILKSI